MSFEIELEVAATEDASSYSARDEIADLLECAARIMRQHPKGERDDSVSWRVADAGMLLRALMEEPNSGWAGDAAGVSRPTGLGALLPQRGPL